ncbi:putative mfs transporter [Diaporthe ampelina]|uniref:Putative mfs transporter n=1 Tax=Diaporthe ampelina TaxID=1214573 RepID=A0A0G2HMR5_9PEZI|nr:putative mfs transporter [Diaporthe ampelina]
MDPEKTLTPEVGSENDGFKPQETHIQELRREQTHADIDPAVHRKLNRKFDLHVIPFLFGIWLLAFIDRSNIGNAKIDGLTQDLGMETGTKFNIALLVFYIPYILVDVPSNWIVKRIRAGIYLPALITAWGLVSTFLGFTKSFGGLVAARLFLGAFEGGLLGGIIVYLAMFYRRHEMLWRMGMFYCAAPLSGAFGGLLATGLATIRYNGYNRWPWIFFIEGIITTVFGVICFFFMPHTPADAKFLSEEERAIAMARLKEDAHGATSVADVNEEKFDWHWSFSLFLPTIITGLGYTSTTTAQLFTVPPNLAAFITVLITSLLSDRIRARGPIMAAGIVVAIAGYIMLLVAKRAQVRAGCPTTLRLITSARPG